MSNYNSDDNISRFIELMNSWQACWSSCGSSCGSCGPGCNGYDDDDINDLLQVYCNKESCSGECEECEECNCKKPNSKTVQDDGCFCRNPKCNDFVPMAEPDGDDGMILCWKCANGI